MYKKQVIGFTCTSASTFQVLAKRIGENGTLELESPVPAPFSGRVELISSNSTVVIHDLRYCDSECEFSSYVIVETDFGAGYKATQHILKPIVSITVNGMKTFCLLMHTC